MLQRVKTFGVGLVVGSGVGAILSLLLTPDSGENLRAKSRQYYQQLLLDSANAAEAKRLALHQELATLTAPTEEKESVQS